MICEFEIDPSVGLVSIDSSDIIVEAFTRGENIICHLPFLDGFDQYIQILGMIPMDASGQIYAFVAPVPGPLIIMYGKVFYPMVFGT